MNKPEFLAHKRYITLSLLLVGLILSAFLFGLHHDVTQVDKPFGVDGKDLRYADKMIEAMHKSEYDRMSKIHKGFSERNLPMVKAVQRKKEALALAQNSIAEVMKSLNSQEGLVEDFVVAYPAVPEINLPEQKVHIKFPKN